MPKLIDHEAREREVAEAAWRVLIRDGIKGVSVRAVAAEAGLAVGSLRRSFPTQSALLVYCIRLVGDNAAERIGRLDRSGDPAAAAVAAILEVLPLDEVRRMEMEVWLVMTTAALSDPVLAAAGAELDEGLRLLARGAVKGLAQVGRLGEGRSVAQESARLHALIDGLALHLIRQPAEASTRWAVRLVRSHIEELSRPA